MLKATLAVLTLTALCTSIPAPAAAADKAPSNSAQAAKARSKPLQRCDQLSGKAELDCLQKARERIVEARRKREASAEGKERAVPASGEKKDDEKAASPADKKN